ncbi:MULTISPECIES: hypothetical protein [unclassified Corynebacterium]|uniref:hypothetical protein n=1 Tax=unclassified Corynebacterium TaxID=2624378 RepID=UPI0034CF2AF7
MKAKEKATAVIRVAVLAALTMLAVGFALNGSIAGTVVAVVAGAGPIYFLVRDWETLRRPAGAD